MTNTATAAERWVLEIEKHVLSKQQIMIQAAADCEPFNKLIREAKAAAKEEGISVKALSALILERKHLRNAANVREKLEDDDLIAELEMLRDQVSSVAGIEDLFSFATEQLDGEIAKAKSGKSAAAKVKKAKASTLDNLSDDSDIRPTHLKEAERQRLEEEAAKRNAAALNDGISKLH